MICKFLSLLFLCGVCISVFGQELQSPQINQNAIFANPGLAGSKGQTRVCTNASAVNSSQSISRGTDSNGDLLSQTIQKRNFYNGLISIDGLIIKNKLGVAGYLKNESFKINNIFNLYQNNIKYDTKYVIYNYTNFNMGLMLAPKFQITAKKDNKQDHVLSPAIALVFKGTQFNYSGPNYYNYIFQDTIRNGETNNTFDVDYVSLSLLYSTSKSYAGVKFNFEEYKNTLIMYNVSFVFAKTYSNKNVLNPKFSFTPQFNLVIPTYGFFNVTYSGWDFVNATTSNKHNMNNNLNANLDFRYGKIIFGAFLGAVELSGFYGGVTGGVQLENAKIIVNYSPRFSSETSSNSGLFLSANFLLKPKTKDVQIINLKNESTAIPRPL